MRVFSRGLTDMGLKRSRNEDFFTCNDELGLYIVADGMGGHAAGEIASSTAVSSIVEFIQTFHDDPNLTWPIEANPNLSGMENALVAAIQLANQAVCDQASENRAYGGMGTTIVGLLFYDGRAAAAHVGDSRLYRLRGGRLEQLTCDHSWVNEQLQGKFITEEEARSHRWRNVITRALGNRPTLEIDSASVDVAPGDLFLLCSDGLSGMVCDEELQHILTENLGDLAKACREIILQANLNGGIDNVTAVIVSVQE
ncbi:MAG: Stp1/IreP family PP2C-type Ser/Thr phosphatase [Candidatus Sumerlaeota bacterium]|nr:Stp1/IreP family PP2C-type Ser/Thr phosphatase [Candidatus Sumerlaeota bacterium]